MHRLMGNRCSCVWPPPPEDNTRTSTVNKKKKKKSKRIKQVNVFPSITTTQRNAFSGRIFVANADAAKDHKLLLSLGVTAVISVGGGKKGAAPGMEFLHFGIKDRSDTSYLPVFQAAVEFAGPLLAAGRSILVHCRGGMHRSPAVAASLLITFAGLTSMEAMQCVKAARPIADFGDHLGEQLDEFEAALKHQSEPMKIERHHDRKLP